jgi:26S proteasome regulatory subunit N11
MSQDTNLIDNSETVYISSLALLKMLRHGRAGVPMEVMGLMLGEFVDDYTVRVVDVFAMPQSGTGVSVEAVDPVFQTKMMDMLRQTGRPETVVGWYHSHPGFGCWLSSVDINTQQSFEQLTPRAVAVVVDPIQSVKGKVVIDAFRLINPQTLMMGHEPRQTTSNLGHLNKPSIQALIHGLNRHYYSIGINYRKTGLEENMLMNLHKHVWTEALEMNDFRHEGERNSEKLKKLVSLAEGYEKRVKEESELSKDQLKTRYVGKIDPKKRMFMFWSCMAQTLFANPFSRHRRHRTAAPRRQHRFRIKANDRQRSLRTLCETKAHANKRPHEWRYGYR